LDLYAVIRDLGRAVIIKMLADALILLFALPYYYAGGINKDYLVAVMVVFAITSLATTLWIVQNRKKERVEAESKSEAERKDHEREADAATKKLEDLKDKYDTTKRDLDEATKALDDLTHKWENKEFEFLIAPLYKQFLKFPGQKSLGSFTHMLSIPPAQWNSPLHEGMTFADAKNKEFPGVEDAVNLTIDVMLSHLELAQKPLQDLIGQYLELRKNNQAYGSKYYDVAEKLVEEIAKLVNTRYFELIK
jgi:hypothetical protein